MRRFFQSGLASLPCGESPNSRWAPLGAVCAELVREGAGDPLVQTPSPEQDTEAGKAPVVYPRSPSEFRAELRPV